jgi:hypothetical protein
MFSGWGFDAVFCKVDIRGTTVGFSPIQVRWQSSDLQVLTTAAPTTISIRPWGTVSETGSQRSPDSTTSASGEYSVTSTSANSPLRVSTTTPSTNGSESAVTSAGSASSNPGLSNGAKAGIAVGVAVPALLVALLACLLLRRQSKAQQSQKLKALDEKSKCNANLEFPPPCLLTLDQGFMGTTIYQRLYPSPQKSQPLKAHPFLRC